MNNITTSFKPSVTELIEIKKWLIQEENDSDEGFYSNWNHLVQSFDANEMVIIQCDGITAGFTTWNSFSLYGYIEYFEIHPSYRKKGLGKILFNEIEEYFKKDNRYYIELECNPKEAEFYWKKQGFKKFPYRGLVETNTHMYKPLIQTLNITNTAISDNRIELWDVRRHDTKEHKPKWIWNIEFKKNSNQLIKPIIFPCNHQWTLSWVKNGEVIEQDEIKYFLNKSVIHNSCMLITELVE